MTNVEAVQPEAGEKSFFARMWKKLLLYPTFLGAIVGAVPQYYDVYRSFSLGVPVAEVGNAVEQAKLWERNFSCASRMKFQTVKTKDKVSVEVGACQTGDVLIRVAKADSQDSLLRWISLQKLQEASFASLVVGRALAKTGHFDRGPATTHSPTRLMMAADDGGDIKVQCQNWLVLGKMLQRVVAQKGQCTMEKIDVLTGKTLDTKPVPCDTQCGKKA